MLKKTWASYTTVELRADPKIILGAISMGLENGERLCAKFFLIKTPFPEPYNKEGKKPFLLSYHTSEQLLISPGTKE